MLLLSSKNKSPEIVIWIKRGFSSPESVSSYVILPIMPRFPKFGGDEQNRTVDPLLARQVLSQLSYTPRYKGIHLFPHEVLFRAFKIKQQQIRFLLSELTLDVRRLVSFGCSP